jgi:hypothetical protein
MVCLTVALAFSFCFFAAKKKEQRVSSARATRNPHLGVKLAKTDAAAVISRNNLKNIN